MMAQAFSSELDSLFNMDSEVDHLGIVQKVHGDDAKPRIRGPAGEDP